MTLPIIGLIVGHFGITALALLLMEATHRRAMAALQESHRETREDDHLLIDILQSLIEKSETEKL